MLAYSVYNNMLLSRLVEMRVQSALYLPSVSIIRSTIF